MLKSSKSRVKTVPPINTVQKEEIIDNAIKWMTESPEKEQEDRYSDFISLFKNPHNVIIDNLK